MGTIQFINTTPDSLAKMIAEEVKNQFIHLKKEGDNSISNELLTVEETCNLLQINKSTLWHWNKKGKVKMHAIGGRRYYLKSELLECIKSLK